MRAKGINKILAVIGKIALAVALTASCSKIFDPMEGITAPDCAQLDVGLLHTNSEIVNAEVNKLTVDLKPVVKSADAWGHNKNLTILISRLNEHCQDLNAELICYACIKTYPPQSEILVQTDSLGTTVLRVLDISTPMDAVLKCIRVHAH